MEKAVLKRCTQITSDQAVSLLATMRNYASSQLVEVFDKIIGKNIDELNASQLHQAYCSFLTVEKAMVRPKIM